MAISQNEQALRRRIGTEKLIGKYTVSHDGFRGFTDIRGEEGDRVSLSGIDELRLKYNGKELSEGDFYSFEWHLEGDTIVLDGTPQSVDNEEFLQKLYEARLSLSGNNLEMAINFQKTIFDEVTGAQHTYIYELLQNANDYPFEGEKVRVNFILTNHYLFFTHTGAPFNLPNVVGITSINQGEKKKNVDTIGYKGIGFKTVFVNNEYVYLRSEDWSFRFDRKFSEQQFAGECPWALMPVPTENAELDKEAHSILDSLDSDMRVRFALKHKADARQNLPLLKKVFEDDQILLFIPNIGSVDVVADGKLLYAVKKDEEKWKVTNFTYSVPDDLRKWVAENVNSGNKVPEKFKDIKSVRISFAVARENGVIKPVAGARVYNYLPTELRLGFGFLINADFIPNGSRSGLHDVEWNNHIMRQAGVMFADWWVDFMKNEDEYDLQSVFSMLPELSNGTNQYANLFIKGFISRIQNIPCIPTVRDGEYKLSKIKDVIFDVIDFFNGEEPIMSDEDFYRFCKTDLILVHPELRYDKNCRRLFEKFRQTLSNANQLNGLYLDKLVNSSSFSEWLLTPSNNIRFNRYLIETQFIDNMRERAIFLRSDGHLGIAGKIYADIDKYADDLDFLEDLLPRIDSTVKGELEKCSNWSKYTRFFKTFDTNRFSRDILENFGRYSSWFIGQDESVKFTHFLGITLYQGGLPDKYPLYDENGFLVKRKADLYLRNELGADFRNREWISDDWIHFLHPDYTAQDEERMVKFLRNRNFIGLTSEQCYRNFIANKERIPQIAEAIKNKESSRDFYTYLWKNTNFDFTSDMRSNYTVLATDGENEDWITINNVIFRQDEEWRKQSIQPWMPEMCCCAICNIYFAGLDEKEADDFQTFLGKRYVVQNCTVGGLFQSMSDKRIFQDVFAHINTLQESKNFLTFLWEYNNTTCKYLDRPEFKKFPVLVVGEGQLRPIGDFEGRIFFYNEDLLRLYNQTWFDKSEVAIISPEYSEVFDNKDRRTVFSKMGFRKFDLLGYVRDELLPNIGGLREEIKKKETNLAFHHFFATIHKELSEKDAEPLTDMPIYISAPDNEEGILVENSNDHYLPSELLNEIISLDIVPIDILDSIHSDYIQNADDEDYLEKTLGNTGISLDGFISYIVKRAEDVIPYLNNPERNINFWNWVIRTVDNKEELSKLAVFPLMSEDGEMLKTSELYISNEYSDAGTQEFIRHFVPGARFIAKDYRKPDEDSDWLALFRIVGVNTSTKDILFKDVMPNLSQYWDESIILELAKNLSAIRSRLDNKDEKFKKQLSELQLICENGNYRRVSETVISGRYYDIEKESYPDILISNLVSANYVELCGENHNLRRQVIELMKLLGDTYKCACENATQLRRKKLEYFSQRQEKYAANDAHYRIIAELSSDYSIDPVGIDKQLLELPPIKLLAGSGILCVPNSLYLSSIYAPHCDYQKYGVSELNYVSDKYRDFGTHFSHLFHTMGVRDSFTEANLPQLANEDFAVYFWTEYANRYQTEIEEFCDADHLRNIRCIPSYDGVKRPKDLYHATNPRLNKIIELLPDGHKKQPRINMPKWAYVGFRPKLFIADCLEYLKNETLDYRQDVFYWIVDTPLDTINVNRHLICNFTECATWYSGAKDWRPLKDLVALEWADGRSPLKDSFGGNAHVCNPSNMPETKQAYDLLCKILGIKILTDKDFKKQKGGKCYLDTEARAEIDKRLLYIAYQIDRKNWKNLYADFHEQLNSVDLSRCEKILYFYNENISADDIYAYIEDPTKLWYVGAWDGKRFARILDWILNTFQLRKYGYTSSSLEKMFELPMSVYLQRNEGGAMPKDFLELLDEADKSGVKIDTDAEHEEGIGEDVSGELSEGAVKQGEAARSQRRQSEASTNNRKYKEQEDTEDIDEDDNDEIDDDEKEAIDTSASSAESSNSSHQTVSNPHSERKHSERTSSRNASREKRESTEKPSAPASVEEKLEKKWEAQKKKGVQKAKGSGYRPAQEETYEVDLKSKSSNKSENPSFFSGKPVYNQSSATQRDHSSEEMSRRKTETQNIAENAQEQLDIYQIWCQTPRYTFKWFKYLMELQFQEKDKKLPQPVQIDFHDWMVIDDEQKVLRMISPSRNIPKWLEDAQDVKVTLLGTSSRRLDCAVLSVDADGMELLINPSDYPIINGFEKIRVNAQNHTNFIDSLQTSFLELDYDADYRLDENLPEDIKFIYGPPGTGKTTRLVSILSDLIRQGEETGANCLNILVLTPTNKAADVIAEKLYEDPYCLDALVRFGYTDSPILLSGDDSCFQNRDTMDLADRNDNVIVTTMARYAYDTIQPDSLAICDVEWDYIIVDEASMVDIVPITYVLHKAKGAKFIIAGDPKQITPISQHNMPAFNIYDMVGLDSFREALSGKTRFPVEGLTMQHRSVPVIGNLVSSFCYDGMVTNDNRRSIPKPLDMDGLKIRPINFLGFKTEELDMLYELSQINESAFHLYSAIFTYNMVKYTVDQIEKNYSERYSIGIVCPYKSQADAIQQMLENKPLSNDNCDVICGTVHKFQGDECDIMFLVLNPPPKTYSGSHINNTNIINVAMSRARDYIFFVMPEKAIDGFHIKERLGQLIDNKDRSIHFCGDIEKTIFGNPDYIYNNTSIQCHQAVNVFYDNRAKYEVRISDTALDIQIND